MMLNAEITFPHAEAVVTSGDKYRETAPLFVPDCSNSSKLSRMNNVG